MKVLRDKKEITLTVSVGELKDAEVVASAPEKVELGLTVQRLTPQMAESLGLDKSEGVVATSIEPGSAADEAGIRRGDVIVEVDRKLVRNLDEYKKAVAAIRKGRGVLFLVRRGDSTLFLALKPQRWSARLNCSIKSIRGPGDSTRPSLLLPENCAKIKSPLEHLF